MIIYLFSTVWRNCYKNEELSENISDWHSTGVYSCWNTLWNDRYIYSNFVLNEVLESTKNTTSRIVIVLDENIQKATTIVTFERKTDLRNLQKEQKR